MNKKNVFAVLWLSGTLWSCVAIGEDNLSEPIGQQLALPSADLEAPTVSHKPPKYTTENGGLSFLVTVNDNVEVKSVLLYYRQRNSKEFDRISMEHSGGSVYRVTIPSEIYSGYGIEYYILAKDISGNSLLHGYSFAPIILSLEDGEATVLSEPENSTFKTNKTTFNATLDSIWKNKWLWIGIGSALAAVAVSNNGDNGDDASGKPTTTSVTINGPAP